MKKINLSPASDRRGPPCAGNDVVQRRRQRRTLVIRQQVPLNTLTAQALPPVSDRVRIPAPLQVRLEREKRHSHASRDEFAQIGKHLRLDERLAQTEVTDVESTGADRHRGANSRMTRSA